VTMMDRPENEEAEGEVDMGRQDTVLSGSPPEA
jgi:hypothetical protein